MNPSKGEGRRGSFKCGEKKETVKCGERKRIIVQTTPKEESVESFHPLCKKIEMKNKIVPYKPYLKELARNLRKNSTKTEIMLWNKIKKKSLGCEFHRQVPVEDYIVDFFCHELMLAIEIDGSSHNYNFEKDEERENILKVHGIKTVRFEDKDVRFALNDVVRALEIIVEERRGGLNII